MNGICITWNCIVALLCLILFFFIVPIYGSFFVLYLYMAAAFLLPKGYVVYIRMSKMYCVGWSKKQINQLLKPPWKLT